MKILFDLFPIVLFFVAYKIWGIYTATGVIIVASVCQVTYLWLRHRRVEQVYMWTFVAVAVLGSATLILRNPAFIKWKPSIVNWGLAIAFYGSQYIGDRTLLHRMMGSTLDMPPRLWERLNAAWVLFFIFCGISNIIVAYQWSENAWVNFKLFGLTGFSLVFLIGQMLFLRGYIRPAEEESVDSDVNT